MLTSWSHSVGADPVLVYPDGCMDLVFDRSTGAVTIAGADTGPRYVSRPTPTVLDGIRFAPGLLPTLLDIPAREFTDRSVPLADAAPRLARRLHRPADARPLLGATAAPGWVRPTVRALVDGAGPRTVAEDLGISDRHLHRRCVDAFGYGPRRLQVILRAGHAIDLMRAGSPLTVAAADAGYADYSHMFRDVVRLTGRRPAQFTAAS